MNNFVLVFEGAVIAVIYSQRINSIQSLIRDNQVTWETEDSLHEPLGLVLQLFRVNTFKKQFHTFPAGSVLRDFCLTLAERMALNSVCAVTRTRGFKPDTSTYEDHVNQKVVEGAHPDPGLNFHTSKGAEIVKTMPGWRPEDTENEGHGVLIEYAVEQTPVDCTPVVHKFLVDSIMELRETESRDFDISMPIMHAGLNSLTAVIMINMVNNRFGISVSETATFNFPTTEELAEHIVGLLADTKDKAVTHKTGPLNQRRVQCLDQVPEFAIIGMSCVLPGGIKGPSEMWSTVVEGRCAVGKVPFSRWDVNAVTASKPSLSKEVVSRMQWGGFVDDLELFDASFFGVSSTEAGAMDPHHRMILEYAWLAFADAGFTKSTLRDENVGVFLGISSFDAVELAAKNSSSSAPASVYSANNTSHSTAAGRVSFTFGLRGPCSGWAWTR